MKRAALIGTLVLSLAAGSAAMADSGRRGHDDGHGRRESHGQIHHREHARAHHAERHDFGHARLAYRAPYRYGAYHRPHGYYSHRWVRGDRLPVAYYSRPYVIGDYRTWELRAPPRGYHWVRVDGDAVLAAVATGIVLDTVFHVFN